MPGLNAIFGYGDIKRESIDNISRTLELMNYDPSYFHEAVYRDNRGAIFFSGYKQYPYRKYEFAGKVLIIEGAIYNKTENLANKELSEILPEVARDSSKSDRLKDFMFSTDGEFIIYYIDISASKVIIFNDAMGRLPAYYQINANGIVLGRALKFVVNYLPAVQYDNNSLMEYFLFSAPLGDHTFFKNISRMMPCTVLIADLGAGKCEKKLLHIYNFDDRHADRPYKEYVKDLHDLFLEGVENRADHFKDRLQVVSLSGGLDSRTVLMALRKKNVPLQAITFRDYYNMLRRDYPVVKQLDKTYNLNVKAYKLIEDNIPYFERMVFLKDGHSIMGSMGAVLNSMEIIEREYGKDIVYYVGDEGNYITAPRYGGPQIDSPPELVRQILSKNSISLYSIDEVAGIFDKKPAEVMDHLCGYFSTYAESDNIHKVDHYFIWERSFKFTMEGQDRTRLFFWPQAPHYSIPYARYAFQIKNEYLNGWKIYRELLRMLDPQSPKIKYSNFGIALDSPLMPVYLPVRMMATSNETVRRNLVLAIRLLKNPALLGRKTQEWGYVGQLRDYTGDLLEKTPGFDAILNTGYLRNLLKNEKLLFRMYIAANLAKYGSQVHNFKASSLAIAG